MKFFLLLLSFLPFVSKAKPLSYSSSCAKSFLDVEQRPGASALFPSSLEEVSHQAGSDTWFVKGNLGVIQSDERPGEYVGFSGVEIPKDCFSKNIFLTDQFNLILDTISSNVKILTLQIITKEGLFAYDLKINDKKDFQILSTNFKRSFRGKISDEVYTKDFSKAFAFRLFLKRSTNAPTSADLLKYEIGFKISKAL